MGPTKVLHLKDGQTTESTLNPSDYGIAQADFQTLKGGDARANAALIKDILSGADTGPRKDIVVINAAAAIIVAGLADEFAQAIEIADESISSGKAKEALEKMITISNA
jgi:anthranilate phosphoribosyltransferase